MRVHKGRISPAAALLRSSKPIGVSDARLVYYGDRLGLWPLGEAQRDLMTDRPRCQGLVDTKGVREVKPPRDLSKTPIYHIADLTNLPGILQSGGLLSDALLAKTKSTSTNIGHSHIKDRRMTQYRVPCVGNRFVGEFVPFYYCPRSPMLYTVNQGLTGRPVGCQSTIVHLVTSIAHAVGLGRHWAIADNNAGSALADFSNDLGTLDDLDWSAIQAHYWRDCKMAKAAEFLVADHFEWHAIQSIGCFDVAAARRVRELLHGQQHQPTVSVQQGWYY